MTGRGADVPSAETLLKVQTVKAMTATRRRQCLRLFFAGTDSILDIVIWRHDG
jgi:hypothetical protein